MIERESEREYRHNRCCSNEEIAFPQLDYYGTCETHFLWRGLVSYPLPVYSNIYAMGEQWRCGHNTQEYTEFY